MKKTSSRLPNPHLLKPCLPQPIILNMESRMDRLKALTGDQEVYDAPAETQEPPVGYKVRAQNIYEGSDSEEDMTAIMKAGLNKEQYGTSAPLLFPELGSNEFPEYKLQYGELAPEGEGFCLWKTVTKYPYSYIGNANRAMVSRSVILSPPITFHCGSCGELSTLFPYHSLLCNGGRTFSIMGGALTKRGICKFMSLSITTVLRHLTFRQHFLVFASNISHSFYLYRLSEDNNQSPILLVPTKQVEYFLAVINQSLGTSLTIPSGAKGAFKTVFNNDGTPYPRYLGRALNQRMADDLREVIPPRYYKLDGEPRIAKPPIDTSLAAFKAKIEAMNLAQKAKKQHNKEKAKVERVAKQQSWRSSTKRVQRYLGLRKRRDGDLAAEQAKSKGKQLDWNDYTVALQQSLIPSGPSTFYDPEKPAIFTQEDAVVFVCIDVEAYEFNNNVITEIGIATLDVLDLVGKALGPLAVNWREAIRARHFRIKESMHLNNSVHVIGCADRFEFGTSEIIPLASAPQIIGSCFRPPFSGPSSSSTTPRNIILVGHDVDADVRFLRQIGYEINNLALHETIDTTLMWRALKREPNPHREEGWSSEGSDGGERITPEAAAAKKAAAGARKTANQRPKDVNALWKDGSTSTGTGPSSGEPKVYYSGTAMLGGVVERVGNLDLGDGGAAAGGGGSSGTGASTGGWKEGRGNGKGKKGGNAWGGQENPLQWGDTNGW
ncbi:qde-2-interacting protein [Rutstroemia sp. NJR-2017a BVV2]|nr:qde-2-interacting protein [Rutstroemia sp. NJR-2017a BVV2]